MTSAVLLSTLVLVGGTSLAAVARLIVSTLRRRSTFANGVLILGTNLLAAKVIEEIEARADGRFRLIGAVDDSEDGKGAPGVTPLIGRLDQFSQVVAVTRPAHIVIAMKDRRGRVPERLLLDSRFRGVNVENAVDFFESLTGKLAIESLSPSSLILSKEFRHADLTESFTERALWRGGSQICAAMGLLVAAPILALTALAIKLTSPGPVFFVQDRVGRGGKPFGLVKFRTMRKEAGPRASEWVSDNAERITAIGEWLRRFRLDELPQLVNVLRGEMNIVGPRPHPVSNHELFLRNIPYYRIRCMVRPGITGWAQVRYGYANDLEEETEKMRYDLYYVKHRCLLFDMRIVIETLKLLLFDRHSHEAVRSHVPSAAWSDIRVKAVS
jgi:exopolysaccharide biosynthesis polyprenyl glycosylphosphotransferase